MPAPNQLPVELISNAPTAPGLPTLQNMSNGGSYLQAPIYTPEQMAANSLLLQLGGQRIGNPTQGFAPYEDYARKQFYSNTVPSLAERFTAMGGGQKSSAFTGALGQAGSDLESQLAMAKSQYAQSNERFGANLLQAGMTPQYNQAYYQPNEYGMMMGSQGTQAALTAVQALAEGGAFGAAGRRIAQAFAPTQQQNTLQAAGQAATSLAPAAAVGAGAGIAAPAVAGATGSVAPTVAATTATTAAGSAPAAAAAPLAAKGIEASIAPALASVGAVAMPAAVLGTLAYALWKGVLEPEKNEPKDFRNPLPPGTWYDKDGHRVISEEQELRVYDDNNNVINQIRFAKPYKKRSDAAERSDIHTLYFGQTDPVLNVFKKNPKGAQ